MFRRPQTLLLSLQVADEAHDFQAFRGTTPPRFVNPAADNYHILFGSAAFNAGANVGVTRDFDGDARPLSGGFDIGYDEYAGALLRLFLPAIMR